MYQYKVKGKGYVYCVESVCENGKFSKESFGKCIVDSACKEICGTLLNRRKNSLRGRIIRKLQMIKS